MPLPLGTSGNRQVEQLTVEQREFSGLSRTSRNVERMLEAGLLIRSCELSTFWDTKCFAENKVQIGRYRKRIFVSELELW